MLHAQFPSPGPVSGSVTNDNAAAGQVGEFISSNLAPGSAVAVSGSVARDVTSISLTPGDWDVFGTMAFVNGGSATATAQAGWINTASATQPSDAGGGARYYNGNTQTAGSSVVAPVGQMRLSLAATTTVYLSCFCTFTGSSFSAYGFIGARRRR